MSASQPEDQRNPDFTDETNAVRAKFGKILLDDRDLCLLACESIVRSFTHEEKQYAS